MVSCAQQLTIINTPGDEDVLLFFPLFLCMIHLRRLSFLSLLFFEILHSEIYYLQRQVASSDMVPVLDKKNVSILFHTTQSLSMCLLPKFLPFRQNW